MLGMIVACDRNGAIGKDGDLPWRQSTDLQHFKNITMGSNLIMGRKTWDSLPVRPLPGRKNVIISKSLEISMDSDKSVKVYSNLEDLFDNETGSICFIGGAKIFDLLYKNRKHSGSKM